MPLTEITNLIQSDLLEFNLLVKNKLHSNVPLIKQINQHLLQPGGKLLRPVILILCAHACGYTGKQHLDLAVAIEFIHNATLLHDDVIDIAKLRRNQPTSNTLWGNNAAILSGDFLYSRAFQILVNIGNPQILQIIANTTNAIAEGEVLQLMHKFNFSLTEAEYFNIIQLKTANLFAATAEIAAILSNSPINLSQALSNYGLHLGIAFQLMDDLLDYSVHPNNLGKQPGGDFLEGTITLPLIYLLQHDRANLFTLDKIKSTKSWFNKIQLAIIHHAEINQSIQQLALKHAYLAKQAINLLPPSPYVQAAIDIIDFVTR